MALQHLRSSTANKRPDPTAMADGQLAINTEATSPGVFFKNASGELVKVGPVHIGTTAPNASPAGQAGNSTGEFWLDTAGGSYVLKLWDGSAWQTVGLPVAGGALTGDLTLNAQSDLRFADSDSSNWVAFQAPATVASNVTWTLPAADGTSGQVLSTNGSGTLSWATPAATVDKIEEGNTSAEVIDTGSDGRFVVTTDGSERLRVDSSGNIAVNTTSANTAGYGGPVLGMYGPSNAGANIWLTSDATAAANRAGRIGFGTEGNTTNKEISRITGLTEGSTAANLGGALLISTKADGGSLTERARIDSSGRLLVGTTTAWTNPIAIFRGNSAGAGSVGGFVSIASSLDWASIISGNTVGRIQFTESLGGEYANISCQADGASGSGDYPGRLVFSTTADGASSPTERCRIDSSGSLLVGKSSGDTLGTVGTEIYNNGRFQTTRSNGIPILVNRLSTDGGLIDFYQDAVSEGNISVSGTTVSYNGAHLSRWSQIEGTDEHNPALRPEILRGTVLSNVNEMCEWIDPPTEAVLWAEGDELPEGINVGDVKEPANPGGPQANEQLNRMKVSDVEGDPNVAGVFQGWDDDDDTYTNDFYCAMTGDFIIRIGAGVVVQRGDLLMSAGDGTAKPQADDLVRSCTVAKVTSTNVSCTYEDGSYCVPCVLMAC